MFKLRLSYVYFICNLTHKGHKMTKKIISLFAILFLLGAPTMVVADEVLPGSTTEWLEDLAELEDNDGCMC